MLEHLFVLIVVLRFIKRGLQIESRGKIGFTSYATKIVLRLASKIGFVR